MARAAPTFGVSLCLPGLPIAQPRGRYVVLPNGRPRPIVPKEHPVHAYRQGLALLARQAMGAALPYREPVCVHLLFIFPPNKESRAAGVPEWHRDTPDLDNLEKAVLDSIRGIIYRDDRQVVHCTKQKRRAGSQEKPCTRLRVRATTYLREVSPWEMMYIDEAH